MAHIKFIKQKYDQIIVAHLKTERSTNANMAPEILAFVDLSLYGCNITYKRINVVDGNYKSKIIILRIEL